MSIFGDLERFLSEVVYPYRYVVTPLLIVAFLGVLYLAYRAGAHLLIRRHPAISAAVGIPLVVVSVVAGNYLLSPLWERSFLEEESPLAAAPAPVATTQAGPPASASPTVTTPDEAGPAATPTEEPLVMAFEPSAVAVGMVMGADDFHFGSGDALIIETEPGQYVLRFENFSVRNGPDLFVYLSEDPTGRSVDEAWNLGDLKATDGAFNYEIPPEIDITRVKSAVVWCRQFSVLFAHAELM